MATGFTLEGDSPKGSIQGILERLEEEHYIADQAIATSVYMALALGRPLLIEGRAGVGKTEVANVLARILNTNLIRLQCYEGLDVTTALYEWNYPKQLLRIRLDENVSRSTEEKEQEIFSEAFLLQRPLLAALTQREQAPVLLIDEVDRADEEFEAFLLEVLSEFQVTIPEIGTIKAAHVPTVVLTSNRTRDLSDALRRRCLYLWIDYPSFEKELAIVHAKVPGISETLARQICRFLHGAREVGLEKVPGVSETLDWATALVLLHHNHLDREKVEQTLGCFVKDAEDLQRLRSGVLEELLEKV
ncbi:MAG: MoxR family ATPase [Dehalococcoidia bacterium]|nr:MoxR family ATPase [Dehalococcoidia bacterium]